MLVDPGQASDVETVPGAGDSYVGQAGLLVIDRARRPRIRVARRAVVRWRGEVVGDFHLRPFPAFGLVSGGDSDFGLLLGGEMGDGGQDGVGAMGVDQVDQGLQVASGGVVGGVVLQVAPGGEQDQFGVGGTPSFFEVAGGQGQSAQAVSSPASATR